MEENNKNTRIEKIKKHIKEHKETYIAVAITGGICLIAGAAATYVYGVKRNGILTQEIANSYKFNWKPTTNIYPTKTLSPYGIPLGRPGTPVIDLTTNRRYENIGLLARHLKVNYNKLARNLMEGPVTVNGHEVIRLDHWMENRN